MSPLPVDFRADHIACRWQPIGPRPDSLALARNWLEAMGVDPTGLRRAPNGRPRLPPGSGDIGWSHSAGRMLLAYVADGVVGADLEARTRRSPALAIARRYFTHGEVAALGALETSAHQEAFLLLWCAREAVLKAAGLGLAFGLERLAFEIVDGTPRMQQCDPALGRPSDWMLRRVAPDPAFIALVATRAG